MQSQTLIRHMVCRLGALKDKLEVEHMQRRQILKSAGCTLFLPAIESLKFDLTSDDAELKRLFCISMGYGFFTDVLPQVGGADYTFSDHMEPLKNMRTFHALFQMKFGGNHHNDYGCFAVHHDKP